MKPTAFQVDAAMYQMPIPIKAISWRWLLFGALTKNRKGEK
jgi:hypothetical protein